MNAVCRYTKIVGFSRKNLIHVEQANICRNQLPFGLAPDVQSLREEVSESHKWLIENLVTK
jgi:hypothetical protein